MDIKQLSQRMGRALGLDPELYKEVKEDETALPQAIAVVAIASVLPGLALFSEQGFQGLAIGVITGFVTWIFMGYAGAWIGSNLLPEEDTEYDPKAMLRLLGFAYTPAILRALAFLPVSEFIMLTIFTASGLWVLVATIIAIRHGLNYQSIWRAIGVYVLLLFVTLIIVIMVTRGLGIDVAST